MRRSRKTTQHKAKTAPPMPMGAISNGDGTWRMPGPSWTGDAATEALWTPCSECGGAANSSARYARPWRTHPGCKSATSAQRTMRAATALLGVDLALTDAAALSREFVAVAYRDTIGAQPVYPKGRVAKAWQHLDRRAFTRAVEDLPRLRRAAGLDPSRCQDGPCAWCGAAEATGWKSHGHKWADRTPAPVCGTCATVYVRRGSPSPTFWEEQRRGLGEALTGVGLRMGEPAPPGLRCFGEDHGRDDGGEAWAYLPAEAVERLRWEKWLRYPAQAPAERREEVRTRLRAQAERQAAERAAQAAAETSESDVYGFGGGPRG